MGLFKRRDTTSPSIGPSSPPPLGRHLHSDLDEEACAQILKEVLGAVPSSYFSPSWSGPAEKAPTTLLGARGASGVTYFAIWRNGGYQEAVGYQEMALVVPGFDPDVPVPMVGRWKQRDPSLKSIGHTKSFPAE